MKLSWKICLRVGLSLFLLYLSIHYWSAVSALLTLALRAATPIFLGCAAAFVLNIPMRFFEEHFFPKSEKPVVKKLRRPLCLLMALLSVAAIIFLVLWLVVPELITCMTLLVSQVPGTLEILGDALADQSWLHPKAAQYLESVDWNQLIERVAGVVLNGFGNVANIAAGVISTVISVTVTAFMSFIFALYVLLSKDRLARQFKLLARRYLKASWLEGGRYVLSVVEDCFRSYIVGQCTEAVILGGLCAAGMLIFRMPYAAVVGATVGFTALIPVAGSYIGGAVGFLLILTVSPVQAFLFVLYLVILQQLEGNIIYPKVVGTSLGLPGVWVLATVIIGGGMGGILGMVLGIPLAAVAYRLIKEDTARKPGTRPLLGGEREKQ